MVISVVNKKYILGIASQAQMYHFRLSDILDSFSMTMGRISLDSGPAQDLIQIHQGLKPASQTAFLNQLYLIGTLLQDFAGSQFHFGSLSASDQNVLLRNNGPLDLQGPIL